MILYRKKTQPILRYTLAVIIIILGLTLTVVDVYGIQLPFGQKVNDSFNTHQTKKIETNDVKSHDITIFDISTETFEDHNQGDDTIPTSVPEPSTIILLASGLGLLRMSRRKK